MASFLKVFAGFFIAGMAEDIIEEYDSGTGIGFKPSVSKTAQASNSHKEIMNDFETWQKANGLLDENGHIDHEAHERFMGR